MPTLLLGDRFDDLIVTLAFFELGDKCLVDLVYVQLTHSLLNFRLHNQPVTLNHNQEVMDGSGVGST